MSDPTNFPLDWPPHWPRRPRSRRQQSSFKVKSGSYRNDYLSVAQARDRVLRELRLLNAQYAVISCNIRPRLDDLPMSNAAEPEDPAVAVYFGLKGRPHVLACDLWTRVACNLAAIDKHIEALRGMERWGVGSIERAFAGFTALPPPGGGPGDAASSKRPWRFVLNMQDVPTSIDGMMREAFRLLVGNRYKELARKAHSAAGGSDVAMAELNVARDEALAELGGAA